MQVFSIAPATGRAIWLLPLIPLAVGTGLPGYSSGWFRLANGQRALLYLTDRTRAVFIPTTDEYGVLISPAEPEEFVRALQTIGRR